MEYRTLPNAGLKVSAIGLGTNNFAGRLDYEQTRKVIHKCLDVGITLIDTASSYPLGKFGGSEKFIGRALGKRRQDVVLATKFGMGMGFGDDRGASRRYIMEAVEESLRNLKTDWIDLYQVHQWDPTTPIEETLRALDDLIRQGKVRYAGCSNFRGSEIMESVWTAKHLGINGFVTCQDEYSILRRQIDEELTGVMRKYRLALLPYFPLASGMLTGKYKRNQKPAKGTRFARSPVFADIFVNKQNFDRVEKLEKFCKKRGKPMVELAFSWLLANPLVPSVIAGASTPQQVAQNAVSGGWKLSTEELAEIDAISPAPQRKIGH